MAKSTAQRVREAEASHRQRGEREIRVWVPDTDEAKAEIREHAARLCAEALEQKEGTKMTISLAYRQILTVLANKPDAWIPSAHLAGNVNGIVLRNMENKGLIVRGKEPQHSTYGYKITDAGRDAISSKMRRETQT